MVQKESAVSNIVLDIVLTFVTCGIYGLVWQARMFRVANGFLGEDRFNFWMYFLLSIVTFGIYGIYVQYLFGKALPEIQAKQGAKVNDSLPTLALILSVVGLQIVAMAIEQNEINLLYERNQLAA
jgi:hypothetical protein